MKTAEIFDQFLKSKIVTTDTRNISQNCIFFALKGANFNGNTFAQEAINQGAVMAIVDEKEFENTIKENKILSIEIENQFYYDNETLKLFYPKKLKESQISTERLKTKEELYGIIHLENYKAIPIKLIEIEQFPADTIITYKLVSRQFPLVEKEIGVIQTNKIRNNF